MFSQCILHVPQKLHLRIYGKGPALILFHPSPNSSKMMHSFASILANHFTVICPDTPGYGHSEKLPIQNPSMKDYVNTFRKAFDELGINRPAIYGSATGAQLAIRYGIEYPNQVGHIFLDNCAHFTDQERADILKSYFPDLTPKEDGSHLVQLWEMVSNLFKYFPWCFQDEAHKLNVPSPPVEMLHSIAMDYLFAGADYYIAYKAAFNHEKIDYIQELTCPTTVLRWKGSILKKYTDRIFEYDLNPNIGQADISADRQSRFSEMMDCIREKFLSDDRYNSEDFKIEKPMSNEVTQSIDQDLAPRPIPEMSGEYLLSAWSSLIKHNENREENVKLSDINLQLIQWYT